MRAIVLDTSALLAILYNESEAERSVKTIQKADTCLISAGTLAEAMIIVSARNQLDRFKTLLSALAPDIIPVTATTAHAIGRTYARYGKGIHPASLNYGDCFAYTLAHERNLPLLFTGQDFSQTDVISAMD